MKPFLLLLFLLIAVNAKSQNPENLTVKEFDDLGRAAFYEGEYKNAVRYFEQSLAVARESNVDTTIGGCASNLGVVYENLGEYEKAERFQQEALAIWERTLGTEHPYYANSLNNIAYLAEVRGDYERAELLQVKAVNLIRGSKGAESSLYANAISNLGVLYESMGRYDEAELMYKEAIRIQKKIMGTMHPDLAISLNNLASIYFNMGRLDEAFDMYLQTLSINEKAYGPSHPDYAHSLNSLAFILSELEEIDSSITLYKKGMAIQAQSIGTSHPDYSAALHNQALNYVEVNEFDKALTLLNQELILNQKNFGKQHPNYAIGLVAIAKLFFKQKDYDKAKTQYKKALSVLESSLGERDPRTIELIIQLGIVETKLEQWDQANLLYSKALSLNAKELPASIELASITQYNFNSYQLAIDALVEKSKMRRQQAKKIGQTGLLSEGQQALQAAIELNKRLRNSFSRDEEKLRVLKEMGQLVEYSLALNRTLKTEQDPESIRKAFVNAELNKSILLADATKSQRAQSMSNLPDSVLLKELKLQETLAELKKNEIQADKKETKEEIVNELNKLTLEVDEFKALLKEKYPNYFRMKYESQSISIEGVQQKLDAKTRLLEYFVGDSCIYLFVVGPKELKLYTLLVGKKRLNNEVRSLRKALSDYYFIKKDAKKAYNLYVDKAYWFYKELLAPALQNLNEVESLIIIADGALGHLPYESFLTEAVKEEKIYAELPYLLNKYKVSYNYSAALWKENLEGVAQKNNGQLLAFAASYGQAKNEQAETRAIRAPHLRNLRDALADLPAVREEVKGLSTIFKGDFLYNTAASEASFKAKAGEYSIIHLAMHGLLNTQYPILSSLAFTEDGDSLEDNFLQAYEISQLKLNAELVVLSACETGYGKFQQGEGVMSLARSFMYAGVPSLVVSMWQVNDESTSLIMQTFYKNLAAGMDKAEALRQAKLNYIKSTQGVAGHPAFWAPFVQLGDSRPIQIAKNQEGLSLWWITGILVAVLAIGTGVFAMGRKKER